MLRIISLIIIIIKIVDNWLNKRFVKGDFEEISETDGNRIYKWGITIISSISVLILIILDNNDYHVMKWFFVFLFIIWFGFQSFMEWKYLEGTKHRASIILMIVSIIIFSSMYNEAYKMQYTTFAKIAPERLNEKSIVRSIQIQVNDTSDYWPQKIASVIVKDEQLIREILDDFNRVELKATETWENFFNRDYTIAITVSNEIRSNVYATTNVYVDTDSDYLNEYSVIGKPNHLRTINRLYESNELEWNIHSH